MRHLTKPPTQPVVLQQATKSTHQRKFKKRIYFPILVITVMAMIGTPVLAEAPLDESTFTPQRSPAQITVSQEADRQSNVHQLILLNECMGCDLAGVTLTEAHLIGADLRQADLRGANLTDSNLEGADLAGADLTGANLTSAFLTNTNLANTQLDGVNFSGAHLYSVDVSGASMNNLNLTDAELFNTPIYIGGEEGSLAQSARADEPCGRNQPYGTLRSATRS